MLPFFNFLLPWWKKAHAQVEFTSLLEAQCRCGRCFVFLGTKMASCSCLLTQRLLGQQFSLWEREKLYKTIMQLKPHLLFDLNPFLVILLYLFFFFFINNLFDLQSKNKTKMTKLVDPVLSISILHDNMTCQVNKENHSITDLGCAKLYYQF